ncbi:hypothetical protein, partial [Falsiroseomonas oryziterrae]|uniref:hypothetical protein n=1 Tax=Falsiroseomonas oryziterrae TaxID=2911368 RepID=UPI001F424A8E
MTLPTGLLARWPHLPAFWPGREVRGGPDAAHLPFAQGPFRPPRLGGRQMPVALVLGEPPDPLAAALAHPATDHRAIPGVLARIAGERIGDRK